MPPVQIPRALDHPLIYPGAPQTLIDAVHAAAAGTGKPVKLATWGLGDVWIALLLWFFLSIWAVLIFGVDTAFGGVALLVATVLPWIGMAGWPLLTTKLFGNGPKIDLGFSFRWANVAWGIGYGLLTVVVAIVLAVITEALFGEFSSAAGDMLDEVSGNKLVLALLLPTVFIGAPIVEEICFRGLMFASLGKRRLAPWLSIIITAAMFALIHVEPVRFILLFGIGAVLALARWHTKSLMTPIIAHMLLNLVSSLSLIALLFE